MYILQPKNDLSEYKFGVVFLQLSPSSNICEQIASTTDLHDVNDVVLSLKALIEPDNIFLSRSLQDIVLLHDLLQWRLVLHGFLANTFQRHELATQPMDGQVDLAKGSFTYDFANLIIFSLRLIPLVLNIRHDRVDYQILFVQSIQSLLILGFCLRGPRRLGHVVISLHLLHADCWRWWLVTILNVLHLPAVWFLRLFGGVSVGHCSFVWVDVLRVNTFSIFAKAMLWNRLRLWVNLVIRVIIVVCWSKSFMCPLNFHSTNYVLGSVFRATSSSCNFTCLDWLLHFLMYFLGWTSLLIIVQKMPQLLLAVLECPWLVDNWFSLLMHLLDLGLILLHVGVLMLAHEHSWIGWSHLPVIFSVVEHVRVADVLLFLVLVMLMGALAVVWCSMLLDFVWVLDAWSLAI